jgi:pimeloyl-ACP methyl ester carboxylesterase
MVELVVLPGLDGTATLHSEFSALAGRIFASVRVVAYPDDIALDYALIEKLARKALPAGPFVLLGESFSGPVALAIAANPPPGLIGLVLSTSFADSALPILSPIAPLVRFLPTRIAPISFLSWWLLGRWSTPELEESLRRALSAVSPSILAFRASITLRPPTIDMAKISVPTLYLRATEDRLLGPRAGEHIRSILPRCTLVDIAGPHLLLQAAPDSCVRTIDQFVQRIIP